MRIYFYPSIHPNPICLNQIISYNSFCLPTTFMIISTYLRPLLKNVCQRNVACFLKPTTSAQRDTRDPILKKQVTRDNFKGYFEDKLPTINNATRELLKEIGTFKTDIGKLDKQIGIALDTHYSTQKDLQPKSLFYLLVAINMHGDERILKHRRMALQFLIRQDYELLEMDSIMIHCFLDAYKDFTKQYSAKKKLQHITFSLLTILQRNFDKVHYRYYPFLLDLLTSDMNNRVTYLRFAKTLQEYLHPIFQSIVQGKSIDSDVLGMINHQKFMPKALMAYNYFNCSKDHAECLFRVVHDYILGERLRNQTLSIDYILKVQRNFPARERAADGTFYKRTIFERVFQILEKINFCKNRDYASYRYTFCSTVIHFFFYEHWLNLTFAQKEGLVFLQKKEVTGPPALPDLFWRIYDQYPWLVNQTLWLRDTIRDCYPDRYKPVDHRKIKQTLEPMFQTEMRIRMEMVLLKLKINFQKEVNISNRFIDFLIEDNIILQLDGTLHFHSSHFENDDMTCYRNLQLVLAGYRLVIISIYEYNLYREVDDLASLLLRKLKLLREEDCAAVL